LIRVVYTTSDYFLLTFFTEDLDFEEVFDFFCIDLDLVDDLVSFFFSETLFSV